MDADSNPKPADSDRGKPAGFDRKTGEVSGSGAGTGNPDAGDEDYDDDLGAGSGGDHRGGEPSNGA